MTWDLDELRCSVRPRRSRDVPGAPEKPLMVIHIGTHKTGTTAVQHYFATHRATLRRAGFVYPKAAVYGEQHATLPAAYMTKHPIIPPRYLERDPQRLVDRVREEVPPGFNALLSSEAFWELLTYLSWHFHDLHEALSRDWRVQYVYMMRDPHLKTWSALKHIARQGMVVDPAATYARDVTLTEGTEVALLAGYPESVRIEYDGKDSVDQLLGHLMSDPVVAASGMTPEERAVLGRMRRRRTPESEQRRINQDHSNPFSAAVTLCVTESLSTAHGIDEEGLGQLPRLYATLFGDARPDWSDLDLPDDSALHQRVRLVAALSGRIMSGDEVRSVRSRLGQPDTRRSAELKHCSAALDVALDALDQRLERAAERP